MKKLLVLMVMVGFVFLACKPALAYRGNGDNPCSGFYGDFANACINDEESDNYEQFDWGAYANLIVYETPNSEWGVLGTYLTETNETRAYAGGKIYINRMFWQKK